VKYKEQETGTLKSVEPKWMIYSKKTNSHLFSMVFASLQMAFKYFLKTVGTDEGVIRVTIETRSANKTDMPQRH